MDPISLITVLTSLINAGINSFSALQRVSDLIQQRQREGREITAEELEDAVEDDDNAKRALEQAISGMD